MGVLRVRIEQCSALHEEFPNGKSTRPARDRNYSKQPSFQNSSSLQQCHGTTTDTNVSHRWRRLQLSTVLSTGVAVCELCVLIALFKVHTTLAVFPYNHVYTTATKSCIFQLDVIAPCLGNEKKKQNHETSRIPVLSLYSDELLLNTTSYLRCYPFHLLSKSFGVTWFMLYCCIDFLSVVNSMSEQDL